MNKLNQKNILLTGASGFLGFHFLQHYPDSFIPVCSPASIVRFPSMMSVDLADPQQLNRLEKLSFDAVIHLAAYADTTACEQKPEWTSKVNIDITHGLCELAKKKAVPFVFTSTDLVFNGRTPPYSEDSVKEAVNQYGKQKAMAEDIVLSTYPQALICRLSLMYGHAHARPNSYFNQLYQQLKSGQKVRLFADEYRSVVSAGSVVHFIMQQLHYAGGIIHLGGKKSLSRYEIGESVCRVFGFDRQQIEAVSQQHVQHLAPRPANVSLEISRAVAMGFNPPDLEDGLLEVRDSFIESL